MIRHISTIWNKKINKIEEEIEKLPVDTVVLISGNPQGENPTAVKQCTLMLLKKYGIKCEWR